MMNTPNETNMKHIHGIICDVTNCQYNEKNKICTAREIKVGPQHADCSEDTVCVTFKPEQ